MRCGTLIHRRDAHGDVSTEKGVLTTAHAMSSHGLPVLLWRGHAWGPGDLDGLGDYCLQPDDPGMATGRAEAAGFYCVDAGELADWLTPRAPLRD